MTRFESWCGYVKAIDFTQTTDHSTMSGEEILFCNDLLEHWLKFTKTKWTHYSSKQEAQIMALVTLAYQAGQANAAKS